MAGGSTAHVALAEGTFSDLTEVTHAAGGIAELRSVAVGGPESLEALAGFSALIVGLQPLTSRHFDALPTSVRVIGRAGIGLDSIDLEAAQRRGVSVVHQPDYATDEVATHAVAMTLALSRRITLGDRIARTSWPSWSEFASIRPLSESTVAVIGLGKIGQLVAALLTPLAGRVIGFDPVARIPAIQQADSVEEALTGSDVITLHAPLTMQTTALINCERIALTHPGALLINVSRGGLIDERAVAEALNEGRLGGAALDVLSSEPPPPNHPLLSTPNTILTPHMAWLSEASQRRLQRWTVQSVVDVLDGTPVTHGRVAVDSRI